MDLPGGQVQRVHPVPIYLTHKIVAVGHGENPIRASPALRGLVIAVGIGDPDCLQWRMSPRTYDEDIAVLYIGGDNIAIGQLHRIVRPMQLVWTAPRNARCTISPHNALCSDIDDVNDLVVLFGGDDVVSSGGEESVVWYKELLTGCQISWLGERPKDLSLWGYLDQPVIVLVRNQHRPGQHGRVGPRRKVWTSLQSLSLAA